MTQTKIDGKFYPLTAEVGHKLRQANLTGAEWRLWSFLVALDPFGDRYEALPDMLTIMEECDLKKSTFYKAIAKFQDLELFDFQDKGFEFRNLETTPKKRKVFRNNGNNSEKSETIPKNRKAFQKNGNDSEKSENQSPESSQSNDSDSPQTIQTYSNLIHTLSEQERERFFNFCKRQTNRYPNEVVLLESWIVAHWDELLRMYRKAHSKPSSVQPPNFSNQTNPSGAVLQNNSKVSQSVETTEEEKQTVVDGEQLDAQETEQQPLDPVQVAIAAQKRGEIQTLYWSDYFKTNCVVLNNGLPLPIAEWFGRTFQMAGGTT